MPSSLATTALGLSAILIAAGVVQAAIAVAIAALVWEIVLFVSAGRATDDDGLGA